MEILLQPDLELWATGYLRAALAARAEAYTDGVYVDRKVPDPRRSRMVIVRSDGGADIDTFLTESTLAIRVWAATDADANDLARMVRALLLVAPDGAPVVKARGLGGPYETADETGTPIRYLAVSVTTRGTAP